MLNGKVISTKLLSRDTYNAMTRIIIKGTKPVETPSNTEPTEPTTDTPTEGSGTETTPPENTGTGDTGTEEQQTN